MFCSYKSNNNGYVFDVIRHYNSEIKSFDFELS